MSTTIQTTSPAPRRRWGAILLAGAVGLLVGSGGLSGEGTFAFWNDSATIGTGSVSSGALDLQVDGNAEGLGTPYTKTALSFANRAPGEFEAYPLQIRNVGSPPGTYTLTVTRGSTWTFGADAIRVQAFTGTVVDDTVYPIDKTCSGEMLGPSRLLADATVHNLIAAPRRLAAGASETICLRVGIAEDAGNANQDKTGSLSLEAVLTQATS